uniref:Uncharacterized protein n=1 Tax=Haptolina brevifila TaxID=156173 RepID=A0A7S2NPF9_9EUKA
MTHPYDSLERLVMAHAQIDPIGQEDKILVVKRVLAPVVCTRLWMHAQSTLKDALSADSYSVHLQASLCRVLKASVEMLPFSKLSPFSSQMFEPLLMVLSGFVSTNQHINPFRSMPHMVSKETATVALAVFEVLMLHTSLSAVSLRLRLELLSKLQDVLSMCVEYEDDDEEGDALAIQSCAVVQACFGCDRPSWPTCFITHNMFKILQHRKAEPCALHAPLIETIGYLALYLESAFMPAAEQTIFVLKAAVGLVLKFMRQDASYAFGFLGAILEALSYMAAGSKGVTLYCPSHSYCEAVIEALRATEKATAEHTTQDLAKKQMDSLVKAATLIGDVLDSEHVSLRTQFVIYMQQHDSAAAGTMQTLLDKATRAAIVTDATKWAASQFDAMSCVLQQGPVTGVPQPVFDFLGPAGQKPVRRRRFRRPISQWRERERQSAGRL